jgi:hypothetical protein
MNGLAEVLRRIERIDRRIDANIGALCRLECVNPMSAASFQRAWDRRPGLRQDNLDLFLYRGALQAVRDTMLATAGRRLRRGAPKSRGPARTAISSRSAEVLALPLPPSPPEDTP